MDFDLVKYNFKDSTKLQLDIVPIAKRLLTNTNKSRTTAPHRTDFHRIIWFQQGNPTHSVDFDTVLIKSPSILFVHKDRIHKFDRQVSHDGKVLIFTNDFILRTENDQTFFGNSPLFNESEKPFLLTRVDERMVNLFNQIESELHHEGQLFKGEILYHLLSTFLLTAERYASTQAYQSIRVSSNASLVNSFYKLLEQNFKQRLTIQKYAQLLNVTVNKLNIAILQIKGKTGKQAVTERLVLEAKRLLTHSNLSVKEIGFDLGFDEPTNFVKFFQTVAKQTPLTFQKENA